MAKTVFNKPKDKPKNKSKNDKEGLFYRKIISFGNSSYVVSLPKTWIEKYKLKKGDWVYFNEDENSLVISPKETETKEEEKEITINVDGKTQDLLRRELCTAYIMNFRTIILKGKEVKERTDELKNLIHDLIALEIIEANAEKIVSKDFLDMEKVSVIETVKKMDLIIKLMFSDLIKGEEDHGIFKSVELQDKDVNRLCILGARIIRYGLKHQLKIFKNFQLTAIGLLNTYLVIFNLEGIGDELKRIARLLANSKISKGFESFFKLVTATQDYYNETMKAYYANNSDLGIKASEKKKTLMGMSDGVLKNKPKKELVYLIDRYRRMISHIHELGRMTYQR